MSYEEHHAAARRSVTFSILTVSDTKKEAQDESGRRIAAALSKAGHKVDARAWVPDDAKNIEREVRTLLVRDTTLALVVTGGTGVAPRDVTVEAIRPLFVKELPGFGERFRALSQGEIGSGAILSRATAGIVEAGGRNKPVFLLPGAPDACVLAVEGIINAETGHLVELANQGVDRRG